MDSFYNEQQTELPHNPYDDIPVYYCKDCLELKVKDLDSLDYCEACGSTNIDQCSIQKFDEMYFERYGKHYLDK